MKIAQVTTFFHPVTGGVESHVLNLSRTLEDMGHEVFVLTSDSNKSGPRIKNKTSNYLGIDVIRFFTLFALSYFHKFYPGILFHLLRNKYDIIHVHGFRKLETYMAMFAGWLTRTPVILTTHNPFPTSSRSRLQDMFVKLHDLTFGKLFTRGLGGIICIVESEKELFKKRFGVKDSKMTVIPNGLDEVFLQPGNSDEFYKDWNIEHDTWKRIALSVGRISESKGLQNLEQSVKDNPDVLFVFVGGDDGYLKKAEFIYNDYKNVLFTKRFLPPESIINFYAAADLFLFPSLHEAFGIVLLEAMSQSTAIISTNRGGPKEVLSSRSTVLLDPTDQQAWSKTIAELKDDEKTLTRMKNWGVKQSKRYAWSKVAAKVEEFYKKQ